MQQHFIGGEWVAGSSGETLPVIDPSTGEVFDQLPRGTAADIDQAVAAARAALAGPWGRMTATDRGRILMKMSAIMLARHEELAQLEARDTGKPIGRHATTSRWPRATASSTAVPPTSCTASRSRTSKISTSSCCASRMA